MEATNVTSQGIVQEVLRVDNYNRWKTLMKNYLLGKDLWDVISEVDTSRFHDPRWKRDNAAALHIIQLSCGPNILDEISGFKTAYDAWNHLSARYAFDLKATPDIEQGVLDDNLSNFKALYGNVEKGKWEAWNHLNALYTSDWKATPGALDDNPSNYKALFRHVEKGEWEAAKSIIRGTKDPLFSTCASGRTVLHVAVIAGHVNIVEGLVKIGEYNLVKMKDKRGYTALALAARYTGNTDVAKRIIEGVNGEVRSELLAIKNKDGEIPVLLAAAKGHAQMTRYLYTMTDHRGVLKGQDRVWLLERCLKAEIFDVALGLLQSNTDPNDSFSDCFLALYALAKTPSAFLSGCRFGFGQRIVYNTVFVNGEGRPKSFFKDAYEILTTALDTTRGRFSKRVLIFLVLPVKLLGRLLFEIKFLNIFGFREMYDLKYTHHQVQQILNYVLCRLALAQFNDAQLRQALVYDAMLDAARHGAVEFIYAMTEANHDLFRAIDNCRRGIFSYAILHRKENVFRLIHTLNGRKDVIKYSTDVFGNNLLHLAGHLGPFSDLNHKAGAALQMQREIQWFKAVEEVVHPKCKEEKNVDGKKPHELFTENHKELVRDGEKWAKETAGSFTLMGTLIITIMFAAAITLPGGNDQDTGVPIFLHTKIFTVFLIADAISLFTSVTSVLIFIGILTSRFAEEDFLSNLPWKLFWGLIFLFLSVVSMIVAFCAALFIILKGYDAYWRVSLGITLSVGSIPIIVLVILQLHIMVEIFRSTWSNSISYTNKQE